MVPCSIFILRVFSSLLHVVPNLQILDGALEVTCLAEGEDKSALIEELRTIGVIHLHVLHIGSGDVVCLIALVDGVEHLNAKFFMLSAIYEETGHLVVALNSNLNCLTYGNSVVEGIQLAVTFETKLAILGISDVEVGVC